MKNPIVQSLKSLMRTTGLRVSAGPFKGLRCFPTESGDAVIAKVCGTYEMEIFPRDRGNHRATAAGRRRHRRGGGILCRGLCSRLPGARIIAYESKPEWQERIRNLLRLNRVGQPVEIRGYCGKDQFRELAKEVTSAGRGLVFMDIEGGEWPLLLDEDFRGVGIARIFSSSCTSRTSAAPASS